MSTLLLLLAGVAAGLVAGCSDVERTPALAIVSFRQELQQNVALNETLVLHFSAPLDPRTVTRTSVRVLDPLARTVEGSYEVRGNRITFVPDVPRSALLIDGSFNPGTTYTLEVAGFPRPDGVRGFDGAMLEASVRTSFRTVPLGADALFVDPFPERVAPFELVSPRIRPGQGIVLECAQGLDPTTVEQPLDPGRLADWAFDLRGGDGKPIPLRVVLTENRADFARLHLRPVDRLNARMTRALEAGTYGLFWKAVERGPATLGGARVPASWIRAARIEVVAPAQQRVVESFDDVTRRSFEMVEGVDGMALWQGDGVVRVRYPRAAGDGRDGARRLEGLLARPKLQATHVEVREGTVAELPATGLVVLASQTSIDIAGTLRRRVERGPAARRAGESHKAWTARMRPQTAEWSTPHLFSLESRTRPATETLSAFLERAAEDDHAWTVLIAGGDLRVSGHVDLDGPLLIVTGGWLRATGLVEARRTWVLPGESGGGNLDPQISGTAPLLFDELGPDDPNPLATTFRAGVLSRRMELRNLVSWRDPLVVTDPPRSPHVRVRLFGVDEATGVEFGPVQDPALLMRLAAVRFLVELEVPPTEEGWDPPRLERIEFAWTSGAPVER